MASEPLSPAARAFKAQTQLDAVIEQHRQAVARAPASAAAEHNLAAALGDGGRWREAEPHVRQAFAKGGDAPETWLILGRCLQTLARLDEAEQAFTEALARRPNYYDAHQDLAQLRWMRSGDLSAALATLDGAIAATPGDIGLRMAKAKTLEHAGQTREAYELVARLSAAQPQDFFVAAYASQLALEANDNVAALALAERAAQLAPQNSIVAVTLISACLGAGQIEHASALAAQLRQREPANQHAIALQATAWRILGDPRYRELYDYDAFVFPTWLETPKAWPNLGAYLADLADGLTQAHAFSTHPFNQSIRGGSQASDLLQHDHPAIRALPEALDPPIRAYLAALGNGGDPLRARNSGRYSCQGIWSIRMRAGGKHVDHVHPQGWISSACYIEAPPPEGKEGWLKFGEPGVRTQPALGPEHFVKPEPGKLVLFPSYMWHGTIPFSAAGTRLTVAFDLAPS